MDDTIRNRLQASFVNEAATRFNLRQDSIEALKGFESFIYAGLRDGQKVILRLAHSLRRTADLIQGELDFMAHLARSGAAVCAPLPSVSGTLVEAVDDGAEDQFLASCFTWAKGAPPDGEHKEPVLRAYGRAVGQMHRMVQGYTPEQAAWQRPNWDDPRMLDVEGWLDGGQTDIVDAYLNLRKQTEKLVAAPANFNLIHQDMHMGNFHVTVDHKITVFDFDDCAYGYFINDLAIVLFHAMKRIEDPVAFAKAFFTPFL